MFEVVSVNFRNFRANKMSLFGAKGLNFKVFYYLFVEGIILSLIFRRQSFKRLRDKISNISSHYADNALETRDSV